MIKIMRRRVGAIIGIVLAAAAVPAAANTFDITPDTSSLNPLTYKWSVSIDGAGATSNPTLVVMTGQTYTFAVSASLTHPFWIDAKSGLGSLANEYTGSGLSVNANPLSAPGMVTMNLPADAPDTLFYACGNHTSMLGSITVIHDLVFRDNFD